jgi:glycosyltransferase 2 family protein
VSGVALRTSSRSRIWQVAGALVIGAACLWFSLRGVRLAAFRAELADFSVPLVMLAVATVTLVAAAKALRWQWLYGSAGRDRPWSTHFGVLMIAQMLNLVIPIRLGEVARLGLMRQEGRPVGVTFGTIVVEKGLDLLAVGLIVLLFAPILLLPAAARVDAASTGPLLGLLIFLFLLAVGRFHATLLRLVDSIPSPQSARLAWLVLRVQQGARAVLRSMAELRGAQLLRVTALTAAIWLISLVTVRIMLSAFGLELGWDASLALMLALTSSNWAPTPPAMIGVVGAVTVAVLGPFGVEQTEALALGTVLNLVLVGPPVLLGSAALAIRLWRMGESLHLGGLREAAGLGGPPERPSDAQEQGHGEA